jgi:hypothetical protein
VATVQHDRQEYSGECANPSKSSDVTLVFFTGQGADIIVVVSDCSTNPHQLSELDRDVSSATAVSVLLALRDNRMQWETPMIRMRAICLVALCSGLLACGSSSKSSVTGRWNVVFTGTVAQQGQQGEQTTFTVSLVQNGTVLTGSLTSLVQSSSCFHASPPLSGSALSGQLTQQGEAIPNFHATIQLPGTGTATNPLSLVGDLGPTGGGGLYTLESGIPSGCQFPTGSFTMNLMP